MSTIRGAALILPPPDPLLHTSSKSSTRSTTKLEGARSGHRDEALCRVLLVSGDYLGYAGCAQRFRRYFPGMLDRGVLPEVLTLTPLAGKEWGEASTTRAHEDPPGVPVRVLAAGREGKRRRRRRLIRGALREIWIRRNLELLHVLQQLPARARYLPFSLALRFSPRPKVLSVTMDPSAAARLPGRWVQRFYYGAFDAILCQSEQQVLRLRELGVRAELTLVPNGVDTTLHQPVSATVRERARRALGLPLEGPLFLYVGSIQPRKGTDLLLHAWRDHRASGGRGHMVLVGPRLDRDRASCTEFTERVDALLEDPLVGTSSTVTGVLPSALEYLRAADAFVFPSQNEGVPNAVLEAMACGLPCLLTPFQGASRQLGRPDREYLACEPDPAALVRRFAQVERDPERFRARQGQAARAWMVEHMDLERSIELHCDLYRRLTERDRP